MDHRGVSGAPLAPLSASAPELRPFEIATLTLHRPDLSPQQVMRALEELIRDLALAPDPRFVPVKKLRRDGPDQQAAPLIVEVRRPDGQLQGVLSCTPRSSQAARQVRALAAHAGVALSGLTRMLEVEQREAAMRRVAEQLQATLLPQLPPLPNTFLNVRYRAAAKHAKVGGDFYDVFQMPDKRVLIVVGDVVGKGLEAAVHTSRITQTLRALALQELDLTDLLKRADEQVTWQAPDIMATLWCGCYEPETGELAFASLGHPPALLLRANGDPIRLELEGLPLGMRDLDEGPPEIRNRLLEPRDLLVLYTDGVVEASGDYLAGQESLLKAVSTRREEPLDVILRDGMGELLADAGYHDDAVMLLLRRA